MHDPGVGVIKGCGLTIQCMYLISLHKGANSRHDVRDEVAKHHLCVEIRGVGYKTTPTYHVIRANIRYHGSEGPTCACVRRCNMWRVCLLESVVGDGRVRKIFKSRGEDLEYIRELSIDMVLCVCGWCVCVGGVWVCVCVCVGGVVVCGIH